MRFHWLPLVVAAGVCACATHPVAPTTPEGEPSAPSPSGSAQPEPIPGEAPPAPAEHPPVQGAPVQGARQFRLGPAASALVNQAHTQAGSGDYGQAAATLERALRIEPDNPLLWIELGRVRLGENNFAQADAMGRKAAALATGDPAAQAAAWRLIADSLRARGRNPEAAEADQRADALSAH